MDEMIEVGGIPAQLLETRANSCSLTHCCWVEDPKITEQPQRQPSVLWPANFTSNLTWYNIYKTKCSIITSFPPPIPITSPLYPPPPTSLPLPSPPPRPCSTTTPNFWRNLGSWAKNTRKQSLRTTSSRATCRNFKMYLSGKLGVQTLRQTQENSKENGKRAAEGVWLSLRRLQEGIRFQTRPQPSYPREASWRHQEAKNSLRCISSLT